MRADHEKIRRLISTARGQLDYYMTYATMKAVYRSK